jgi:putative pyruvate formate lyase activating enzyme
MRDFEPSYLALHESRELHERAQRALMLLGEIRCRVCPRLCKVDRLHDQPGLCRVGRHAVVASYFAHFGEEDCLRGTRGSGTIFFSGCNLRCVFCLPPGTLIATEQGTRPIDELFSKASHEVHRSDGVIRRPDDLRVYTLTGEPARVSKVFRHYYRGELVRVKPLNAPAVSLTPNHQVFAVQRSDPERVEKVPAGSLTNDHLLMVPKRVVRAQRLRLDVGEILAQHASRPVHVRGRRVDESRLVAALSGPGSSREVGRELGYHPTYVRRLRGELARGEFAPSPGRSRPLTAENGRVRFVGEHRPGIPATAELDSELGWLLGIYCAEGHVHSDASRPNSHRLVFSIGPHEDEIVRRVSESLRRAFGVSPTVVDRRTTKTVEVGKASLALLFRGLCGTGSRAKRVPKPIFAAPEAVVRSFLGGYLTGDGTTTRTHLVANTVSPTLAHGLYELGLRLGVLPSIHRWVPPSETVIEGRTVRQAPLWLVKFKRDRLNGTAGQRERTRWKDAGNHFLVPIHRIEREPYDGDVYNLEVAHPTHSYLAPAVAVANCQNHEISWQLQGERVTPRRLARMMLELQELGCHNINWVTPEHVVPQILEALPLAVDAGLRLPTVYNTSAYDSPESLELMDGVVDVYMPDFKLWSAEVTRRYLAKRDYAEVARHSVLEMKRQVGDLVMDEHGMAQRGLIVRHLVMPGLLDETEAILRFIATQLGPGTYVNLMAQYYPAGRTSEFPEIDRHLHRSEFERALDLADELGLRRLDQRSRAAVRRLAAV